MVRRATRAGSMRAWSTSTVCWPTRSRPTALPATTPKAAATGKASSVPSATTVRCRPCQRSWTCSTRRHGGAAVGPAVVGVRRSRSSGCTGTLRWDLLILRGRRRRHRRGVVQTRRAVRAAAMGWDVALAIDDDERIIEMYQAEQQRRCTSIRVTTPPAPGCSARAQPAQIGSGPDRREIVQSSTAPQEPVGWCRYSTRGGRDRTRVDRAERRRSARSACR